MFGRPSSPAGTNGLLDIARGPASHHHVRRYVVGLLIAVVGAGVGWAVGTAAYWLGRPHLVMGACPSQAPGVPPIACATVADNFVTPPDPTAVALWLVAGALVALALAAVVWLRVRAARERRAKHGLG